MYWLRSVVVFLAGTTFLLETTMAKNFGKYGTTFVIQEEGLLTMIQRKLKGLDLASHQHKLQLMAQKQISEPKPVMGIGRTKKSRSFNYDPSYELAEDIYLPGSKLLHAAGTKINPLDHITLEQKMIFIDSRDVEQITWVERLKQQGELRDDDKIILVAGKPFELEKELKRAIYFDQFGELTGRFGIKQVPAMVKQQEKLLHIAEINIDR